MFLHPRHALDNSSKYYFLSDMEQNIIVSHMFPFGVDLPRYKESLLVDFVDDYIAIYEAIYAKRNELRKDTERYVPRSVIRRMAYQFEEPTFDSEVHIIPRVNVEQLTFEIVERYLAILSRTYRSSDEILGKAQEKREIFHYILCVNIIFYHSSVKHILHIFQTKAEL